MVFVKVSLVGSNAQSVAPNPSQAIVQTQVRQDVRPDLAAQSATGDFPTYPREVWLEGYL